MPSFSDQQRPNLVVANQRLHLEVTQARAELVEWRNRCATADARRRTAIRALTSGDTDAALRALTEEEST